MTKQRGFVKSIEAKEGYRIAEIDSEAYTIYCSPAAADRFVGKKVEYDKFLCARLGESDRGDVPHAVITKVVGQPVPVRYEAGIDYATWQYAVIDKECNEAVSLHLTIRRAKIALWLMQTICMLSSWLKQKDPATFRQRG